MVLLRKNMRTYYKIFNAYVITVTQVLCVVEQI